VQEQSCSDFECIVVDDGSATPNALKGVVEGLGDPRFRYVWQENGGGGAARNTGIGQARGRYIAFLDSDDFFLPGKLAAFAARMSDDPSLAGYSYLLADRGVGRYWRRPDRPIRPYEDMGEYLFVQNQFIQTSTIVLHREAALRTMFDPTLRKGQDLDFCLRLHRDGVRFFMIEEPLVIWSDVTEVGRTSRTKGYEAPIEWLDRSRPLLSRSAELGYRSTVLAYYLARHRPVTAAKDLLVGWALAGVPAKVTLRQAARAFLPRAAYRKLVNSFVGTRGQRRGPSQL
jgi:glycosyltransferase involved in cell wall biosynthesis